VPLRVNLIVAVSGLLFCCMGSAARASCADLATYSQNAIEAMKNRDAIRATVHSLRDMEGSNIKEYMDTASRDIAKGAQEPCSDVKVKADYQMASSWLLLDTVGLYAMQLTSDYEKPECKVVAQWFAKKGLAQAWYGMWVASARQPRNEYFDRVDSLLRKPAAALDVSLPSYAVSKNDATAFYHGYDENYEKVKGPLLQLRASVGYPMPSPCSLYNPIPEPAH
jgi:hypothetical protein